MGYVDIFKVESYDNGMRRRLLDHEKVLAEQILAKPEVQGTLKSLRKKFSRSLDREEIFDILVDSVLECVATYGENAQFPLLQTLNNKCLNKVRNNKVANKRFDRFCKTFADEQLGRDLFSPDDQKIIVDCLLSLNEYDYALVVNKIYKQTPFKDMTGVSTGTAFKDYYEALKKLKELYWAAKDGKEGQNRTQVRSLAS